MPCHKEEKNHEAEGKKMMASRIKAMMKSKKKGK